MSRSGFSNTPPSIQEEWSSRSRRPILVDDLNTNLTAQHHVIQQQMNYGKYNERGLPLLE